jgi:putative hydrolase of the HAD superfamily
MIRTVISDLGKVVLWFDNNIFLRRLADRSGRPFEEVRTAVHGDLELLRRFDAGAISPAGFHARVMAIVGADMPAADFYAMYNDIFTPNAGVIDVLSRAKSAGYKLLLLSNTDPERFGFVRRTFPALRLFDGYVLSYELQLLKPDPAIYRAAARTAGSEPDECVFIDDMEENVRAAIATGLAGIHYRPETDLAGELMRLGLRF